MIFVGQAKFDQVVGKLRAGDFDLPNFTQAPW
jgi:hypothetical protein